MIVDQRPRFFWPARLASLLLHPAAILPVLLLFGPSDFHPGFKEPLPVLAFTVLLPALISVLWLIIRRENDFFIIQRPNRALPLISYLLSSVLFVVFTSYVAQDKLDIPVVLLVFIVMAGVSAVVTFFWKISLHTLGWGAAFVFATVRWEFEGKPGLTVLSVCCLVVAGISRFHLRAHDIAQLAAGLILGVLTACLLVITL